MKKGGGEGELVEQNELGVGDVIVKKKRIWIKKVTMVLAM